MSNIRGDASTWSRGIVVIHGAGDWPTDYSIPMVERIKSMIDSPDAQQLKRVEVNYSDVLNSTTMQTARAASGDSSKMFMNALVNEHLQSTMNALKPEQLLQNLISGAPQLAGVAVSVFFPGSEIVLNTLCQLITHKSLAQIKNDVLSGIGPTIQDVCVYLYAASTFQNAFRQKLIDKLHEAQQYDEVILVSHSLGTVIAFDVLNAWTEAKPNITSWFTMGCPLAKALRLASGRQSQLANPQIVDRWYNVYNTHDLVANMLSPTFVKDGVYDIFVDVKDPQHIDPASAHDYFTNDHALKLVADAINAFG